MSMDTQVALRFSDDIKAHDLISELEELYKPITVEGTSYLYKQFYTTKLKQGEDISAHLSKFLDIRKQLHERGNHINDDQMNNAILGSLNIDWEIPISKFNHIPFEQRTTSRLCKFLTEEGVVISERTKSKPSQSALRFPIKRAYPVKAYVPRQVRCYNCGDLGHTTPECRRLRYPAYNQPRGKDLFQRTRVPEYPVQSRGSSYPVQSRGTSYRGSRGHGSPSTRDEPHRPANTLLMNAVPATVPVPVPVAIPDTECLWTLDSGAAFHATHQRELFLELGDSKVKELLTYSNEVCKVEGAGPVYIAELDAVIQNVMYIPRAKNNLLSQYLLSNESGYKVTHDKGQSVITKNGASVAQIIVIGNVYYLKPKAPKAIEVQKAVLNKPKVPNVIANAKPVLINPSFHHRCVHKWHRRLAHPSFNVLSKMGDFVKGYDTSKCNIFLDCSICNSAKSRAAPVAKHTTRMSTRIFDLVHVDLVGPFRATKSNNRYFLTIVDNYSRFGFVYLLKQKSDTFQAFKDFAMYVYNQFNLSIRRIQTDRGGEFMSGQFQSWMRRSGIVQQTSASFTPAHNGVAERRNGVLQTMMRCLLEDAGMSDFYWAEAVKYANYIHNRTWSSVLNQTPYYMLHGYKPYIGNLRIFGSYATVNIPLCQRRKGGPVSERLRFVGFDSDSKYHRFIDNNNFCVVSNSAKFEEDSNWSRIHSNDTAVYFPRRDIGGTAKPDDRNVKVTVPDVVSPKDDDSCDDAEDAADQNDEWTTVQRRSKRTTRGVPPKRFTSKQHLDTRTRMEMSGFCTRASMVQDNLL